MDTIPTSSTPLPRDSQRTYGKYLQSPRWFHRRNRSLRLADYTCQRCGVKRNLQVHHRAYERVGDELDSDLEVVCRGCHLGHHAAEAQANISVYIKLAREVLREHPAESLGTLLELVKRKVAPLHIAYDTRIVLVALQTIGVTGIGPVPQKVRELLEVAPPGRDATRAEAAACVSRLRAMLAPLGVPVGLKHMPEVKPVKAIDVDKARALQMVQRLILDSIAECEALERKVEP